jgi:hypothetical protein
MIGAQRKAERQLAVHRRNVTGEATTCARHLPALR